MNVSNCNFSAVKWDGQAIEAVTNVSKALLNLTNIFTGQNIHVDCMVKVEPVQLKEDEKKKVEDAENEAKEAADKGDVETCKAALIKAGKSEDEAVTASEKMVADAKAAKENVTITASELQRLQTIEADKKASDIKVAAESYSAEFLASNKGGKVAPAGKEALIKLASSLNDEQKELLKSVLTATADQTITKVVGEDNESGLTATEQYNNLIKKYMSEGKSPSEANKLVKAEHKQVYEAFNTENK